MRTLAVGVAGLGAVGGSVARALDDGIPGLVLTAIATRSHDKARQKMAGLRTEVPLVSPECQTSK